MRTVSAGVLVGLAVTLAAQNLDPRAGERYAVALALFRDGNFLEAGARAHAEWQNRPPSDWYWRFRLLEADALIQVGKSSDGLALLGNGIPHASPEFEIRRRSLTANVLVNERKFDQADALLAQARTLAEQSSRHDLEPEIDLFMAKSLRIRGRPFEAETYATRAGRSAQAAKDQFRLAVSLNFLGVLRMDSSRWEGAIEFFNQAEQIWRRQGTHYWTARALLNLGLCYDKLGDFHKALNLLEENERTLTPGQLRAQILAGIGLVYLDEGDVRKAIPYYRAARDMSRQFGDLAEAAGSAGNLTYALADVGEWDEAERSLKEATALGPDPNSRPYLDLEEAAIAQGRSQFDHARSINERVLASNPTPVVMFRAYVGVGDAWMKTGNFARADQNYDSAMRVVEQSQSDLRGAQSKFTYLAMLIRFYQSYVDSLMERKNAEKALSVADSSRARVLSQRIDHKLVSSSPKQYAEFSKIARQSKFVWLSYWLAPKRSFLWVTTPKETRFFELPKSDEIAKLVEDYRRVTDAPRFDPLITRSEAGQRLYKILIDPAAPMLTAGARVIVVPDGPLHQLSFETLPVYGAEKPHYWMDDVTIAIAPSFGVFQGLGKTGASQKALIVGNPISPGPNFPTLTHAAEEMADVAKHLPPAGQRTVTGLEARPDNWPKIKPGDFDIIHIAAHAEANPQSPLDSAVILSPGSGFRLYARDIMEVPLHADLVTLSACRSAGAKTYAGEGLVGLTWAFLQAGSRAVVAGLWDVPDTSTAQLMDHFYAAIAAGSAPADALQKARLELRKGDYKKPYYWGAFQCYLR